MLLITRCTKYEIGEGECYVIYLYIVNLKIKTLFNGTFGLVIIWSTLFNGILGLCMQTRIEIKDNDKFTVQ